MLQLHGETALERQQVPSFVKQTGSKKPTGSRTHNSFTKARAAALTSRRPALHLRDIGPKRVVHADVHAAAALGRLEQDKEAEAPASARTCRGARSSAGPPRRSSGSSAAWNRRARSRPRRCRARRRRSQSGPHDGVGHPPSPARRDAASPASGRPSRRPPAVSGTPRRGDTGERKAQPPANRRHRHAESRPHRRAEGTTVGQPPSPARCGLDHLDLVAACARAAPPRAAQVRPRRRPLQPSADAAQPGSSRRLPLCRKHHQPTDPTGRPRCGT